MALSAWIEDGITGANGLVAGAGAEIRTWANGKNAADLPAQADFTLPAPCPNLQKIRGVLLGYMAYGGRDKGAIPTFRDLIKGWLAAELTAELRAYRDASKLKQGVILMPSFRHANSANRENAKSTLAAASTAMMKAYLAAIKDKGLDATKPSHLKTWFGVNGPSNPADLNSEKRYSKVIAKLKKLTDVLGTKPIKVYYRGTNIKGPSDDVADDGAATKEEAFAAAFALGGMPAEYLTAAEKPFAHVTLGEKFFNFKAKQAGAAAGVAAQAAAFGGVAAQIARPQQMYASTSGSDSVAGVLVHELSHNICDTDDVALPAAAFAPAAHPEWKHADASPTECYGQEMCQWLAANNPELAINNADCYEYYFEEYQ